MVYKVLNQYLQPEWLNAAYHCTENFQKRDEKEAEKLSPICRQKHAFICLNMHFP
jgi:CRISPR/Cas system CMR-associated protein Cmr5 small subunit